MEERLFFIGLAMAGYYWLSKRFKASGALDTPGKIGLWHGAFTALSGFSISLVLIMSMETRSKFITAVPGAFTTGELYPSLAIAAICGVIGFWRGLSKGQALGERQYYLNEDAEWAETVFSAVLLAAALMYFVIQAFKIPSGSMESTLLVGDHLFVNKFIYGARMPFTGKRVGKLRKVQRGDIVVFRFPSDDRKIVHCGSRQFGKDFIKRVIALPGETVEIRSGEVKIDGKPLGREPYAQYVDGDQRVPAPSRAPDAATYQKRWQEHELDLELEAMNQDASGPRDFFGPVTVPDGAYFAMGDNRDRSCDSRYWGPIEERYVKGKAWFIYWPPSRMRLVQ
jgi:signal peptidase I